ncbi:hypothetical protein VRK_32820 [Vibrio sp. MEBiC08052]|nr:hypothetical protein VRK_32820 [Vibrio sp. MEBiC08052]
MSHGGAHAALLIRAPLHQSALIVSFSAIKAFLLKLTVFF